MSQFIHCAGAPAGSVKLGVGVIATVLSSEVFELGDQELVIRSTSIWWLVPPQAGPGAVTQVPSKYSFSFAFEIVVPVGMSASEN
jgi:hypothetical protein